MMGYPAVRYHTIGWIYKNLTPVGRTKSWIIECVFHCMLKWMAIYSRVSQISYFPLPSLSLLSLDLCGLPIGFRC